MKTKFTKKGRRILSAALCLLMMITALPMSAFAWTSEEGKSCTSSFGDYYVGSDGEYYRSKATYSFIVYDSKGNITVQSINAGNAKRKYLMTDNSGTHQVYCVESGVDFNTGNSYVSKSGKNSSYFQNLPTDAQFGIMMALMYGWHEGKSSPVAGTNADDYAFATQTIIWEYQQQLRTSPSNRQSANGIDGDTYYYSLKGRPAEKCYDWILSQMSKHYTIPSFAARSQSNADTYTLKYNPDTKKYSLTLEDTNNTLSDIKFSASGISVTRSGNKYTFTSDKMITSPVTVSAQKNVNLDCGEMLIWGCVGKQTMVSGASDPVYFYLKIDTETYGTGQIKKTSEDGVVSGISFNISGNGVNKTVTTGADGTVDVQLMPGVYTVTEQSIDRYEPQSVQRVTIVSGHTATVTFNNTLKRGSLEIIKNSEDNLVEGVKFHLYGTSLSGLPVDEYAVTDKNGVARFENVLISGETPYTVEEVDTAVRYVVPESQTAPIEWEKVTSRSFTNILKKFNVTVTKSDAETDLTAADGTVIPADGLIEIISLDENGKGTVNSDLPFGSYYVKELSTNSAYVLNEQKYPVHFEYAGQDTAVVHLSANDGEAIENEIIYGSVSGLKSDEDGNALGGAVIGIFKTGTEEFTKENAIQTTTSADDGSFSFEKVPYGTWVIREIESPTGFVLSEEEIAVTVGKVDEVVEIELVNYFIKGNIELTKVDADYPDNKLTGAVFEVYADTNGNGEFDKDDKLCGEMTELEGGVYQMTELRYGKYFVREKTAPDGFVLDEGVYGVSIEENGKTYTVENKAGVGFINDAQKGSLKIVKTSSDGKVEGFSFRVTSADGYDQTFKTDKNGEIFIEGLRIGEYTVSEVSDSASAGYILPADKQATVKTDSTTIVEMHNEFRDTPKTGDDFNLGLWVSLAAATVIGAGVLGFVGFKKKKKED